jgi:hypothetical protein
MIKSSPLLSIGGYARPRIEAWPLQTSPDDEILRLSRALARQAAREDYKNEHAPEETKKEQRPVLDSRRIFRMSV